MKSTKFVLTQPEIAKELNLKGKIVPNKSDLTKSLTLMVPGQEFGETLNKAFGMGLNYTVTKKGTIQIWK